MTPLTQVISTQTQTQINSNSSQTHHGVAYYILTYATYVDRDDGTDQWMLLHIDGRFILVILYTKHKQQNGYLLQYYRNQTRIDRRFDSPSS